MALDRVLAPAWRVQHVQFSTAVGWEHVLRYVVLM